MKPPELPPCSELEKLFPESTKPPSPQTFEIGLVLGGTVSAGTYTAGALDLLFQVLDQWYEGGAPLHNVKLTVVTGSSGGAVCAAILGVLANRKIEHVTDPPAATTTNHLWNVWVDSFSFDKLTTDVSDLDELIDDNVDPPKQNKQHVPSIFNCRMLDDAADSIVRLASQPPDFDRQWIAQPLRMGITVSNTRGVPYRVEAVHPLGTYKGSAYLRHDDFAWFAVPTWLQPPPPGAERRPDEFWVADPKVGYETLSHWATASGAMPVGFKARPLSRPLEHYLYRPRVRPIQLPLGPIHPAGKIGIITDWPLPDWDEIPEVAQGTAYAFSAVDAGALNDDPVGLAHRAMAGLIGFNPRDPELANRALFMIDPLVDQPTLLKPTGVSAVAVAELMPDLYLTAARYLTADLDLFARQDVFSRFQLVPTRTVDGKPRVGKDALAATGPLSMGGWLSKKFRIHDFMLGRCNMKQYLTQKFILRADNGLFDRWFQQPAQTLALRQRYAVTEDGDPAHITAATQRPGYYLPVIPIADKLQPREPDWPVNAVDLDTFEAQLKGRLEAVLKVLRRDNLPGFGAWVLALGIPLVACQLAKAVSDSFRRYLIRQGLLSSHEQS